MPTRPSIAVFISTLVIAAGCAEDTAPEPPSATPTETAAPEPAAPPDVSRSPAPTGAMAYIVEPADGATVTSPVRVAFGLKGMGVAPAGVELPNTGHHHLLIDTELASLDAPIPADAQHIHFGLGQTETTVELEPGSHELRLVLGDHLHIPHDPPVMSDAITIQVSP